MIQIKFCYLYGGHDRGDSIRISRHASDYEIMKAVLQRIANSTGERVYLDKGACPFTDLDSQNYVEPDSGNWAPICSVDNVRIFDCEGWKNIAVNPER